MKIVIALFFCFFGSMSLVIPVFQYSVENGCAVFGGNVVIQLDVDAKTALGQIQTLNTFRNVVEDLRSGGKGEQLAVKIKVNGYGMLSAADTNKIVQTVCPELGIYHIHSALHKIGHDLIDAAVRMHIDQSFGVVFLDHTVKLHKTGLHVFSPPLRTDCQTGLHSQVVSKGKHLAAVGKTYLNLASVVFKNLGNQSLDRLPRQT